MHLVFIKAKTDSKTQIVNFNNYIMAVNQEQLTKATMQALLNKMLNKEEVYMSGSDIKKHTQTFPENTMYRDDIVYTLHVKALYDTNVVYLVDNLFHSNVIYGVSPELIKFSK